MNTPETNEPIEKLLREQDIYVDDHGFTERVMARLPRRRRARVPQVVLCVVFVAGLFCAIGLPWKSLPALDYTKVFSADSGIISAWLPIIAVLVALVSAARGALRWED